MRFTRHAKNRLRLYGIIAEQVERIVAEQEKVDHDHEGHEIITGEGFVVVVDTVDDTVVTLWEE